METFLGIDLGGTKLLIGEVSADGRVLRSKKYASGHLEQGVFMDYMLSCLDDYAASVGFVEDGPSAIGVGLIGRIDAKRGVWMQIDRDREGSVEVATILSARFGVPCFVDNDVKSATKAEILWGGDHDKDNFLYLNLGTGIASGAVVDGHLISGGHFNAGETGHVESQVSMGIRCCCGRYDCVELIASGMGIDMCARKLGPQYDTRLPIPENERVDVKSVVKLMEEGDPLCKVLIENATTAAAGLVMDLIRCYDPQCIVLGGSIAGNKLIFDSIVSKINPFTARFVIDGIIQTSLDPSMVGLLGAAANAIIRK